MDQPMTKHMAKKSSNSYTHKKSIHRKKKRTTFEYEIPYTPDPSPLITHFLRPDKRFNILPFNTLHTLITMYLDILPENFVKRHYYINRHFPMSLSITTNNSFNIPIDPINSGWSKEKSIAIRKAVKYIMKIRFLFKKLLNHMRFKRLQRANEEDVVTGEVPKYPVQIVSWSEKRVYTFEAYTLMKDITERILHHDGFFEDPQEPRNPFTNIPFTQSQTISVWNSLSRAGIPVSSAFTLFRNSRYDMKRFIKENSIFLKLSSLRRTFKDAKSYYYKERLLDFIDYCYSIESIECSISSFRYALIHYPNHYIIKKWSLLCEKYYEPEILYPGNVQMIDNMKELVLDNTYEILDLQKELISLNNIVDNITPEPVLFEVLESLDFLYNQV